MHLWFKIIDYFRKTETVKIYDYLLKSQWMSNDKIAEIQFENLKKLLIHANTNVPFYNRRFLSCGFNPLKFSDLSELSAIPILTKDEVRENFDDIKAKNFDDFIPRITQTGGSTGKPFITFKDKFSHSYLWANNFRGWNAAGYELGDRFIQIATGSLLPNTTSINNKLYNYFQNSQLVPSYHLSEEKLTEIIRIVNKSNANFIYGYSSTISLLANYCVQHNVNIRKGIKAIFTSSDMLYQNQRDEIEKAFNTKVFDIYGCPEGGVLTFECNNHSGYHINQESAYITTENINELGIGNIISTPLFNYAFPLIKYNTGDVGKIETSDCTCGRGMQKISELGGRIRDFVILEDGRYIHGAFFNHLEAFYNADWIKQYQIIQNSLNELTLKFTCSAEPVEEDLKKIKESLRKGLLPNLNINFDFSGVEYTKGGKFRLIISKVKNDWE